MSEEAIGTILGAVIVLLVINWRWLTNWVSGMREMRTRDFISTSHAFQDGSRDVAHAKPLDLCGTCGKTPRTHAY